MDDLKWLEACDAMAAVTHKCAKAQYFCFVIDRHGRVRGAGYNGTPSGMDNCVDGGCPRYANGVPSSTPYDHGPGLCWAVHAEVNALMGLDRDVLVGSTLYVNGTCCVGCAKQIAGSGVRRVVTYAENRSDTPLVQKLFDQLGITFVQFDRPSRADRQGSG
jgi:dCMP deaminase